MSAALFYGFRAPSLDGLRLRTQGNRVEKYPLELSIIWLVLSTIQNYGFRLFEPQNAPLQ